MRKDGSLETDGINNNTYTQLFDDSKILNVDMVKELPEASTLMQFTFIKDGNDFLKIIEYQKVKEYAKQFITGDISITKNLDTGLCHYSSDNYNFDFKLLSSITDDKEMIDELFSQNRSGHCHANSIEMCLAIPDSYLVTGYANNGENKFLHSVCTYIDTEGKEMCIDYTRNLIMPYYLYKSMNKFKELNRIESEDVASDLQKYPFLIDTQNMSLKLYCLFRDDIVKDIEDIKTR